MYLISFDISLLNEGGRAEKMEAGWIRPPVLLWLKKLKHHLKMNESIQHN